MYRYQKYHIYGIIWHFSSRLTPPVSYLKPSLYYTISYRVSRSPSKPFICSCNFKEMSVTKTIFGFVFPLSEVFLALCINVYKEFSVKFPLFEHGQVEYQRHYTYHVHTAEGHQHPQSHFEKGVPQLWRSVNGRCCLMYF